MHCILVECERRRHAKRAPLADNAPGCIAARKPPFWRTLVQSRTQLVNSRKFFLLHIKTAHFLVEKMGTCCTTRSNPLPPTPTLPPLLHFLRLSKWVLEVASRDGRLSEWKGVWKGLRDVRRLPFKKIRSPHGKCDDTSVGWRM